MNKLYVCYSYYHLYVTIIKVLRMNAERQNNIDIIITDQIPNYNNVYLRLKESDLFRKVILVDDIKRGKSEFIDKNLFYKTFFVLSYKKQLNKIYKDINLQNYEEVNIYFDRQHLSQYIINNHNNIVLLEDSRYSPAAFKFNKKTKRKILEKINLIPPIGGSPRNICQIECSDISMLPNNLKHKYRKSDIYQLEAELNDDEKAKILKMFGFSKISLMEKSCLVLTQPLFGDRFVSSEEKQLKIYKNVINNYCIDFETIYIKPHPRDNVDYKGIKNTTLLDKNVPFEIYDLLNINFDKYITLFSTSIKGYDKGKVMEIGYGIDDELTKNYTSYIKD